MGNYEENCYRDIYWIFYFTKRNDEVKLRKILKRERERKKGERRRNGLSILATRFGEARAKRINDLPSRDFLSSGLRDMRCTLRDMRYLRRRVIVSVSVPGNLTFSSDVMVGNSLPPDGRLG